MNFLFWNVNQRAINQFVADLVESTTADVLVLAEYTDNDAELLRILNDRGIDFYALPVIGCQRIRLFSSYTPAHFVPLIEADRYSIWEVSAPSCERILLASAHLRSKLFAGESDQRHGAATFRKEIEQAEQQAKHQNTIVLGDFNMNPFESGMIEANGLHSVSCLRTAQSGGRTVQGNDYSFFYNPTWNLFGDRKGVPGTYFRGSSSIYELFWHMLDQVVLRPVIAERFRRNSLRIVTRAGRRSLLGRNGRPAVSDHLPITFSVGLEAEGSR